MNKKILLIDDEEAILTTVSLVLKKLDCDVVTASNIFAAKKQLKNNDFTLCITDMNLPDGDGFEILDFIQEHKPLLPTVMITAYSDIETAVMALKKGAFDYIPKPVNIAKLREIVAQADALSSQKLTSSDSLIPEKDTLIIGKSDEILQLQKQISKIARSQANIYIYGESGTGKELVAKQIHNLSSRNKHNFIAVNCGAVPNELFESEFFGHKKGSFTGAFSNKTGFFVAANKGTLFLDEVADLPLNAQVKLLRALQEKKITPIGSTVEEEADVRILCATHKNLDKQVAQGTFRQDLYYRLNIINIKIPPLRDRKNDIELLAKNYLKKLSLQYKQNILITKSAINYLKEYDFPGNVRELENILEKSYIMCDNNEIDKQNINFEKQAPELDLSAENVETTGLEDHLNNIEKQIIIDALNKFHGSKVKTAEYLQLSMRSFRYKLEKLNIK